MAPPNKRSQRPGGTAGGLHVIGSVQGHRQFPRPPLNRRSFGGETQQNLPTTTGSPNLTKSGLYWLQNRHDFVKMCGLWRCILDSERQWRGIMLAMDGTGDRLQTFMPVAIFVWQWAIMIKRCGQGGVPMRKLAFGSIILLLITFGWGKSSLGEQVPVPQGELRV